MADKEPRQPTHLARVKQMEKLQPKRQEIMSAMQEVLTDLRCRNAGNTD